MNGVNRCGEVMEMSWDVNCDAEVFFVLVVLDVLGSCRERKEKVYIYESCAWGYFFPRWWVEPGVRELDHNIAGFLTLDRYSDVLGSSGGVL